MSNLSQFIGGGKLCTQEFLASGTFTPSTRLLALGGKVLIEAVGGGASGGVEWSTVTSSADSGTPGGDAGQYIETIVTVTGPVTVTIGAGGVRASVSYNASAAGNPGSDTTFGSLVTAKGGICGQILAGSNIPVAKGGSGALSIGGSARNAAGVLTDTMGGKGINGRAGGGAAASSITATAGTSRATDGAGGGMYVSSPVTADVLGNSAADNSGAGGGAVVCLQPTAAFFVKSGAGGSGWLRATWFE